MDTLAVLQELVRAYGPAGQEDEVREVVATHCRELGHGADADAKGNLVIGHASAATRVLVCAHLDEISLLVRRILPDGRLTVACLGGTKAWKLGEGPVEALGNEPVPGVLSFGGVHTEDQASVAVQAREKAVDWDQATVFTGLTPDELGALGVRPGTRVVVAKNKRDLWPMGDFIGGYFLDDRADLAAMLQVLEVVGSLPHGVVFAATAAEEVGGEGALHLMHRLMPDVCLALELAPQVPDAPIRLDAAPALWVHDAYAASQPRDIAIVASAAEELGIDLQFQALSRGGSDASCAANRGLCARPITLGLPMENSHGFEIIHRDAIDRLAQLTVELVRRL